jgi:glucuronoarabinoxylan endo-1,4-beta-xylanase
MSSSRSPFDSSRILVALSRVAALAAAASGLATACVQSAGPKPKTSPQPAQVALTDQHQVIAGFGASSAWTAPSLTDAEADQFFSPDTGIGLSLLRVRIAPDLTTELATAQSATARGVSVWAAPWSPPAELKDNNSTSNGGSLLAEDAPAWASQLAGFAANMAAAGVPLMALSAQNEPNFRTSEWDTCIYTPAQLVAFIRDNLGPALAAQGLTTPILAPETKDWTTFEIFADPILADTQGAAAYVGILAAHDYGGSPSVYGPAQAAGKQVWETEVYDQTTKGSDPGIDSGLVVAQMIHDHLVYGEVNAWHYWWLKPRTGTDNGALASGDGQLTRRAYVVGNWSRFVRPGFVRVDATPSPQDFVYVSAFADPASGRVVIVAVNSNTADMEQVFSIPGSILAAVTPWITSADLALAPADPVPIAGAEFTFVLPRRSVTTFVGGP